MTRTIAFVVAALRADRATLVIDRFWSDGRQRMTTSVPIDVLPR